MRAKGAEPPYLFVWVSDVHWPLQDAKAWSAFMAFLKDAPVHTLICGGDMLELASVSKHNQPGPSTPLLRDEVDYARRQIAAMLKAADAKRLVWLNGNHEWRLERWAEFTPLEGMLGADALLGLSGGFGFNVVKQYGELYRPVLPNGAESHLSFTHGSVCTTNHAKAMLELWGCNVVYGHTHRPQMYLRSAADGVQRGAWGTGGLTNLQPEYMRKHGPSGWTHGFLTAWIYGDGTFHVDNIQMHNGRFAWGKELYHG